MRGGAVVAGVVIIAVGLALLAERLGMPFVNLPGNYWPLFLVALGLIRFIDPPAHGDGRPRSRRFGAWLIYVGAWGYLNELHWFGFTYRTSWPLLVIGIGIGTIWRAIESPGGCGGVRES